MRHAALEPVAVAVLAKAPLPGAAKTRLAAVLGPQRAAALQQAMTERTVSTACEAAVGPVCVWATPNAQHDSFRTLARRHGVQIEQQPDGDLGARMLWGMRAASGPVLVIGAGCPAFEPGHLRRAAAHLRQGLDAVLIAADDGGYVLIGTRRPQPALFADMTWSTDMVAAETRRRMARLGLSWREPARLWDVDTPQDLERLRALGRDLIRAD